MTKRKMKSGRCDRPACKARRDGEAQVLNALSDTLRKLKELSEENETLKKAVNWKALEQMPS